MANPWRFAVSVLSLVIDRLWSNSKRTGVRMACRNALPKVTSLFVLHGSVGSRLGMAKDIRRFGAKGPAMGMLQAAKGCQDSPLEHEPSFAVGLVTFTQVHNARKFPRHPLRHFLANA